MDIEEPPTAREHNLVMYASSELVSQYFSRYSEDISKIIERESSSTAKEFSGGLHGIIGKLSGSATTSTGNELVKEFNFNEDYRQVRVLMNVFSESDLVYPVGSLRTGRESPTNLYSFDSNLQLFHSDGIDGPMIEVHGLEDNIEFSGYTSPENWSSRSHVYTALKGVDPYPFRGVFLPMTEEGSVLTEADAGHFEIESLELTVKFLYILAPDEEEYLDWSNYQRLLGIHPKDIDSQGVVESNGND